MISSSAKRRLFTCEPVPGEATTVKPPPASESTTPQASQQYITFQQAQTEDGTQACCPACYYFTPGDQAYAPVEDREAIGHTHKRQLLIGE